MSVAKDIVVISDTISERYKETRRLNVLNSNTANATEGSFKYKSMRFYKDLMLILVEGSDGKYGIFAFKDYGTINIDLTSAIGFFKIENNGGEKIYDFTIVKNAIIALGVSNIYYVDIIKYSDNDTKVVFSQPTFTNNRIEGGINTEYIRIKRRIVDENNGYAYYHYNNKIMVVDPSERTSIFVKNTYAGFVSSSLLLNRRDLMFTHQNLFNQNVGSDEDKRLSGLLFHTTDEGDTLDHEAVINGRNGQVIELRNQKTFRTDKMAPLDQYSGTVVDIISESEIGGTARTLYLTYYDGHIVEIKMDGVGRVLSDKVLFKIAGEVTGTYSNNKYLIVSNNLNDVYIWDKEFNELEYLKLEYNVRGIECNNAFLSVLTEDNTITVYKLLNTASIIVNDINFERKFNRGLNTYQLFINLLVTLDVGSELRNSGQGEKYIAHAILNNDQTREFFFESGQSKNLYLPISYENMFDLTVDGNHFNIIRDIKVYVEDPNGIRFMALQGVKNYDSKNIFTGNLAKNTYDMGGFSYHSIPSHKILEDENSQVNRSLRLPDGRFKILKMDFADNSYSFRGSKELSYLGFTRPGDFVIRETIKPDKDYVIGVLLNVENINPNDKLNTVTFKLRVGNSNREYIRRKYVTKGYWQRIGFHFNISNETLINEFGISDSDRNQRISISIVPEIRSTVYIAALTLNEGVIESDRIVGLINDEREKELIYGKVDIRDVHHFEDELYFKMRSFISQPHSIEFTVPELAANLKAPCTEVVTDMNPLERNKESQNERVIFKYSSGDTGNNMYVGTQKFSEANGHHLGSAYTYTSVWTGLEQKISDRTETFSDMALKLYKVNNADVAFGQEARLEEGETYTFSYYFRSQTRRNARCIFKSRPNKLSGSHRNIRKLSEKIEIIREGFAPKIHSDVDRYVVVFKVKQLLDEDNLILIQPEPKTPDNGFSVGGLCLEKGETKGDWKPSYLEYNYTKYKWCKISLKDNDVVNTPKRIRATVVDENGVYLFSKEWDISKITKHSKPGVITTSFTDGNIRLMQKEYLQDIDHGNKELFLANFSNISFETKVNGKMFISDTKTSINGEVLDGFLGVSTEYSAYHTKKHSLISEFYINGRKAFRKYLRQVDNLQGGLTTLYPTEVLEGYLPIAEYNALKFGNPNLQSDVLVTAVKKNLIESEKLFIRHTISTEFQDEPALIQTSGIYIPLKLNSEMRSDKMRIFIQDLNNDYLVRVNPNNYRLTLDRENDQILVQIRDSSYIFEGADLVIVSNGITDDTIYYDKLVGPYETDSVPLVTLDDEGNVYTGFDSRPEDLDINVNGLTLVPGIDYGVIQPKLKKNPTLILFKNILPKNVRLEINFLNQGTNKVRTFKTPAKGTTNIFTLDDDALVFFENGFEVFANNLKIPREAVTIIDAKTIRIDGDYELINVMVRFSFEDHSNLKEIFDNYKYDHMNNLSELYHSKNVNAPLSNFDKLCNGKRSATAPKLELYGKLKARKGFKIDANKVDYDLPFDILLDSVPILNQYIVENLEIDCNKTYNTSTDSTDRNVFLGLQNLEDPEF